MQQWMPSVPKNYRGVYLPYTWFLVNAGLLVAYMRRRDDEDADAGHVRTATASRRTAEQASQTDRSGDAGEAML